MAVFALEREQKISVTKMLSLSFDSSSRKFRFDKDDKYFDRDYLLRKVIESDFLPRLNSDYHLKMDFMKLTSYVQPEVFQIHHVSLQDVFGENLKGADKSILWDVPLHNIFYALCQDRNKVAELFPKFKEELFAILTGAREKSFEVNRDDRIVLNKSLGYDKSAEELMEDLELGKVDARTMVIINAVMRAYGHTFDREVGKSKRVTLV